MEFESRTKSRLVIFLRRVFFLATADTSFRDFIRRKIKRHVQINSIRHFALPEKHNRVVYDYPVLNIDSEEYCGVYRLKNVVVHLRSGFVFYQSPVDGDILIEESSKDFTDHVMFNTAKKVIGYTDTRNIFQYRQRQVRHCSFEKDVYLFYVRRNVSNFYHFMRDDLCPLLLLIKGGYTNILILHSKNLHSTQLEFLEMLKTGLGIDYRVVPDDEHIVITSNVIITQSPNKKYFKSVYTDKKFWKETFYSSDRGMKTITDLDYFKKGDYVGKYLPDNWELEDKNYIWGKYEMVKVLPTNTAAQSTDIFTKAVLPDQVVLNPSNDVVYISRKDVLENKKYGTRFVANEDELIQHFPYFKVVSFTGKTQKEIVEIAYNARILIGLHGAGLTAGFLMRRNTAVIELHPRLYRYPQITMDFKIMCDAKELHYIGVATSELEPTVYAEKEGSTVVDLNLLEQAVQIAERRIATQSKYILQS